MIFGGIVEERKRRGNPLFIFQFFIIGNEMKSTSHLLDLDQCFLYFRSIILNCVDRSISIFGSIYLFLLRLVEVA